MIVIGILGITVFLIGLIASCYAIYKAGEEMLHENKRH